MISTFVLNTLPVVTYIFFPKSMCIVVKCFNQNLLYSLSYYSVLTSFLSN